MRFRVLKNIFQYNNLFACLVIITIANFIILVISNISALDSVQTSVSNLDFTDFVYRNTGTDDRIVDTTLVLLNISRVERDKIAGIIRNISANDPEE